MTNPFDNDQQTFKVLQNQHGEYSLWPQNIDVPAGWEVRLEAPKMVCVDYIDTSWASLRPAPRNT